MATGANMSFTIVVTQMTIFGVVHVHDVITIMVLKRWRLDAYVRYANYYVDIEAWSDEDDDDNDDDDDDDGDDDDYYDDDDDDK